MRKLVTIFITCISTMLTGCSDDNTIEFTQKGNSSSGSYWEYDLSCDNILKEIQYEETSFLGPGYTQHWTFEIIGTGYVTINWLAYEGGRDYSEKKSCSVTYEFFDDGSCKIIE